MSDTESAEPSTPEETEAAMAALQGATGAPAPDVSTDAPADGAEPAAPPVKLTPEQEEAARKTKGQQLLHKVASKQAKLKERVAAHAREREAFEAERRGHSDQANAWAKSAEELRQLRDRAKEDPLSVLEALGIDYGAATRQAIEKGSPEEKITALERELKAEKAAREASEKKALESHQAARVEQATASFISHVSEDKSPYSETKVLLRAEGEAHIADLAWEIQRQLAAKHGNNFTRDDVAKYLEKHAGVVNTRRRSAYGSADQAASSEPNGAGPPGKTSVSPRGTRTLTNRHAAESSGAEDDESDPEILRARALKALQGR